MRVNLRIAAGKTKVSRARLQTAARLLSAALNCKKAEVSIFITTDHEIRALNREWRGLDRATDVLSWSQLEGEPAPGNFLGDIVISAETAARQAGERGLSIDREMARLLTHGFLHLLGHDHVKGGKPARLMRGLEEQLMETLDKEMDLG